jgi:hypothetical protein
MSDSMLHSCSPICCNFQKLEHCIYQAEDSFNKKYSFLLIRSPVQQLIHKSATFVPFYDTFVQQAINFRNLDKVSTRSYRLCRLVTFTKHHGPIVGYSECLDVPVLQTIGDGKRAAHQAGNDSYFWRLLTPKTWRQCELLWCFAMWRTVSLYTATNISC